MENSLSWFVGHHAAADAEPETWVAAQVPGAVQLDWARAHGWPDYAFAENYRAYRWMEDVYWTYRATLDFAPLAEGEQLWFVCGGVDYACEVWLGGQRLHAQTGMFTPIELDLTGRAQPGDELRVRVFPAPKSRPAPDDRDQANHSAKPAMSYGWDFHPRLIPLGIWQEAGLERRSARRIAAEETRYRLSPLLDQAEARLSVDLLSAGEGELRWTLWAPDGQAAAQTSAPANQARAELRLTLEKPQLWWPHDQGQPALYRSVLEWAAPDGQVIDRRERRIGFREIKLVMNPGAWDWPAVFPKTRSHAPMTLEINRRRVFVKGSNWVHPGIFPGAVGRDLYAEQLALAKGANLNLLRCWGGAPAGKEDFYDLCDELGLLVWQEFPLACNLYPDDPAYLATLDRESRSLIGRLRGHASLALWCGGNELFNSWSGMTDQSLALRLLNRNCFDLDPERPFLATSPLDGVGHGGYQFWDEKQGKECWQVFQDAQCTAYTEFGVSAPAPVETLQAVLPAEEQTVPPVGPGWAAHHALNPDGSPEHLQPQVYARYLGPLKNLGDLVEKGQLLQAEGLKGLFEEVRRQQPAASMAVNWCFNEPWPTACNCSVVAYPSRPKPALAAIGAACRPVLASARIRKFSWRVGEWFDPELWVLNDAPQAGPEGWMEVWLRLDGEERYALGWDYPTLPAAQNLRGPRLGLALPWARAPRFQLVLRVPGRPEMDSEYTLVLEK